MAASFPVAAKLGGMAAAWRHGFGGKSGGKAGGKAGGMAAKHHGAKVAAKLGVQKNVQHDAPAGDHRAVDVHPEDVRPREDAAEPVERRPLDEVQPRVGPVLLVDVVAEGPPVAVAERRPEHGVAELPLPVVVATWTPWITAGRGPPPPHGTRRQAFARGGDRASEIPTFGVTGAHGPRAGWHANQFPSATLTCRSALCLAFTNAARDSWGDMLLPDPSPTLKQPTTPTRPCGAGSPCAADPRSGRSGGAAAPRRGGAGGMCRWNCRWGRPMARMEGRTLSIQQPCNQDKHVEPRTALKGGHEGESLRNIPKVRAAAVGVEPAEIPPPKAHAGRQRGSLVPAAACGCGRSPLAAGIMGLRAAQARLWPGTAQVPSRYLPSTDQGPSGHRGTVQVPSKYRPGTVPVPSGYRPGTVQVPSKYRPSTVQVPSKYRPSTVRAPSKYRPGTVQVPSRYRSAPVQ
eukprot:gene9054-biopygen13613